MSDDFRLLDSTAPSQQVIHSFRASHIPRGMWCGSRVPDTRPAYANGTPRFEPCATGTRRFELKLRSLQDLLGRSQVGRDPAAIISRAIDSLLVETLKRKAATTDRPRPACDASGTTDRPRPGNATSNVEFHHKNPFAKGGRHDADNLELRCAAHNQYQADLDFGRTYMDARRSVGERS